MNEDKENLRIMCLGRYANTPLYPGGNEILIQKLLDNEISKTESIDEADIVIFCEYLEKDLELLERANFPVERRVLLLMEPEVVLPSHYGKRYVDSFGVVIRVGRPQNPFGQTLNWPQFWRDLPELALQRQVEEIVMIAGNKISFIPGELYGLRRSCAFKLTELALYGSDWDTDMKNRLRKMVAELLNALRFGYTPKFSSARFWFRRNSKWLGAPNDKEKKLQEYRYSLVIENSTEFLSEKLFDSFFAGCIPIYVGPDVRKFGIPSSLVVSVNSDLSSIKDGIKRAKKIDYANWHRETNTWLRNPRTKEQWAAESYFCSLKEILKSIHLKNSLSYIIE